VNWSIRGFLTPAFKFGTFCVFLSLGSVYHSIDGGPALPTLAYGVGFRGAGSSNALPETGAVVSCPSTSHPEHRDRTPETVLLPEVAPEHVHVAMPGLVRDQKIGSATFSGGRDEARAQRVPRVELGVESDSLGALLHHQANAFGDERQRLQSSGRSEAREEWSRETAAPLHPVSERAHRARFFAGLTIFPIFEG